MKGRISEIVDALRASIPPSGGFTEKVNSLMGRNPQKGCMSRENESPEMAKSLKGSIPLGGSIL